MTRPLVVRARRAIFPDGERPAALAIEDGVIRRVDEYGARTATGADELDAGESVLLPGLVDVHVHVNDPGRAEWEGFETATRAAVAGGITTIVDMPLNSLPPTTSAAALRAKRAAAAGRISCDVAFWGGAVPGNASDIAGLAAEGACGVKAFLADSGVSEFPPLGPAELREALAACARLGLPLLVHAEDPTALAAASGAPHADPRRYSTWLESRPAAAERLAVARVAELLAELGREGPRPRAHVVHLSAAEALPILSEARRAGHALTAETCPHYLTLAAEATGDGETLYKCAPPVRGEANRRELWRALEAGTLDLIASDHSPSPPEGKALESGDFLRAWGGISSLGLQLPVLWEEVSREGSVPSPGLVDLARWLAEAPARLAGFAGRKGALAPGADADFVLFDPEERWTVEAAGLWTRHRLTPYAGRAVRGRVRATYLGGRPVFRDGRFSDERWGRCLRRPGGAG